MKTKKFDKKLVLNKKTIANVSNKGMEAVQGGKLSRRTLECPGTCFEVSCNTCPAFTCMITICPDTPC
jgi:hypothetical protein